MSFLPASLSLDTPHQAEETNVSVWSSQFGLQQQQKLEMNREQWIPEQCGAALCVWSVESVWESTYCFSALSPAAGGSGWDLMVTSGIFMPAAKSHNFPGVWVCVCAHTAPWLICRNLVVSLHHSRHMCTGLDKVTDRLWAKSKEGMKTNHNKLQLRNGFVCSLFLF